MENHHAQYALTLFKLHHEKWIMRGLYYGYPVCCIVNFCISRPMLVPDLTSRQEELHDVDRFGFCPCPECAKKEPEEVIKQVMEKRTARATLDSEFCIPWATTKRKFRRFIYRMKKKRPGSRWEDFQEVIRLIEAAQKRAKKREEKALRKANGGQLKQIEETDSAID